MTDRDLVTGDAEERSGLHVLGILRDENATPRTQTISPQITNKFNPDRDGKNSGVTRQTATVADIYIVKQYATRTSAI